MSKPKATFYEIFNKSPETKTVDILIYGAIPDLDWDDWTLKNTADKFVKDFKKLEQDFDRINIHINSPGGSLYHAFPIYNAIANSKKDIHTYNDGLAASAGGVLLIAGKKVHSAKNAFLMIHRASAVAWGNATIMRDTAEMLEKYEGLIADRFAEKSGMEKDDFIAKYFNGKDHFLTAEEAKEEGFIDEIEEYESEDAPPSNIKNMAFNEIMNLYRPEAQAQPTFLEKIANYIRNTFKNEGIPTPPVPPTPTTDMNFEKSISLLGKEQMTAEDIAAVRAEIEAYRSAGEKFSAEEVQTQVTAAVEPLQTEITALATEKANVEALLTSVKAEKETLATENGNLKTQNSSLNLTIEAYRKSGVKIDNTAGNKNDIHEEEEEEDVLFSETDAEVKKLRAEMGHSTK